MLYFFKILKTSRPFLWFTHFTLLIFGGLQSNSFHFYSFPFFLSILTFSLPFSLFIYAVNDYYDIKSDLLNPRKGTIFGEKHDDSTSKNLLKWGLTGLMISLLLAYFMSFPALITLIILSVMVYLYSAPFPHLKSIPIVDAISGGSLYFSLTMIIGYFLLQEVLQKYITFFFHHSF